MFTARRAAGVDVTYKTVDTCAAEFAARDAVPLRHLRGRRRGRGRRPARGGDPRQRAQPHRAGRRVRLLLRARRVRAVRRGLRDRDAQLQPRDGVHRLRHQRPPLLRAAHARGRPRGVPPPAGALDRARRAGGRDRRPRRADAAEAGAHARSGGHSRARHQPRLDRPRRGPRALPARCANDLGIAQPPGGTAGTTRGARARWPSGSASPCWSGRRTCSAAAPCRSSTTSTASTTRWRRSPPRVSSDVKAGSRPSGRCSSTGSSRTRSRSTSTRCATRPATSSSAA